MIDKVNKSIDNYGRNQNRFWKFVAISIEAVTGILGASAILTEQKPYLTLGILCLGAIANKAVMFINTQDEQ